jgi:HlyD family secretion protein
MDDQEKTNKLFTNQPKWKLAIIVSIVGIILLIFTANYTIKTIRQEREKEAAALLEKPAPITSVTALGRLEPQGEVIRLAAPPNQGGAKIQELLIKEGDLIKINQIVAVLDNRDRKLAELNQAKMRVKVAQANLEIVKAGAKQGEIDAQKATIDRLKAQLEGEIATNNAKIARLEAELEGESLKQAATIKLLEAELNNAESEFQRYRQLEEDGAIAESELDQRRLTVDTGRERLEEAKALRQKTIITLEEQIREVRADFNKIQATLTKEIREAEAVLAKIAEIRPVDVQKAEAEVQQAIADLNYAETDLELTVVRSPIDGKVLKIHAYPGENVNSNDGIAELGITDRMMAIAEVYESDINKVRVGQRANIRSEGGAFQEILKGEVIQIGQQIGKKDVLNTDPAADVDVRVIEVKILIDPEDSEKVSSLTYAKVITEIFFK